jgi:hypothetical protein
MKKLAVLAMFAVGLTPTLKAQAPSTPPMDRPTAPVMTFEVMEYNFGTIKQGESVTREFRFRNTGKEPLLIKDAQGSCGCTVPEYPKEPIKPNGEGVIKVTFNSAGKMGSQDKTVTITYDTDKQVVLHLKGTVTAPETAAPAPTPAPASAPVPAPKAVAKEAAAPASTSKATPKQ